MSTPDQGCRILHPYGNVLDAADLAVSANPVNAPQSGASGAQLRLPPEHIALLTSRYWGRYGKLLRVRFLEKVPSALADRIVAHMNAWHTGGAGVQFLRTSEKADVRITLASEGYWSYLGTDIRTVPQEEPTLCLQGFTLDTPESEYRRVVRHEAGHTLGFPHEHMRAELVQRVDPGKAYAYFARYDGWDRQTVDEQVLTSLEDRQLFFTSGPDTRSIMCYQLPGSVTRDGRPVLGGEDIDPADQTFANAIYPLPHAVP